MDATPYWALSLMYWLHMAATVAWIGALAALTLVILPAARTSLEADALSRFLEAIQRRLDPLAWISLVVLAGTGLFQMSANPNYTGLLSIDNRWAAAILTKHLLFLVMGAVSAYLTWGLLPRLQRNALLQAAGKMDPAGAAANAAVLQRQEQRLVRLNLLLGILVLALTALARAA